MMNATETVLFGAAHSSPAEVVARVAAVVGRENVYVAVAGESIPRRRAYVVTSVGDLVSFSATLFKARATVVVCDSLPALLSVNGMVVIDAEKVARHSARWAPAPINCRQLTAHLRRKRPTPVYVEIAPDDIIARLITSIRKHGVLDKVLTFSHRLSGKPDRERVQGIVLRYLTGKVKLAYVEAKLRPARAGTKIYLAYQELIDSLSTLYGHSLMKATTATAATGWDPVRLEAIAHRFKIDPFEVRYLACLARKTKEKRSKP